MYYVFTAGKDTVEGRKQQKRCVYEKWKKIHGLAGGLSSSAT